jgi:hypothetical protein
MLEFALIARPEGFVGALARLSGEGRAWDEGRLDGPARQRLLTLAGRLGDVGLIALFAWSFLAGALLLLAGF